MSTLQQTLTMGDCDPGFKGTSHLPEAVTGDIDHGVIVGARHCCCPELHSVCRA